MGALSSGGGLPSEYQEVEYIESTGTQYINTNFYVNSTNIDKIRLYVDEQLTTNQNSRWLLTGSSSFGQNAIYVGIGNPYIYYGVGNDVNTVVYVSDYTKRYVYDLDVKNSTYKVLDYQNNNYIVNLTSLVENLENFSSNGLPLWLMGYSGEDSIHSSKLFSGKVYENDILQRDLVPCYRKVGGEIGMYDLVNDIFYTNAGTGTFRKGADVN